MMTVPFFVKYMILNEWRVIIDHLFKKLLTVLSISISIINIGYTF